MNNMYFLLSVCVIAIITFLTRAIPFLLFGNREIPATVKYLGSVLPPAIMIILVCYCLRNLDFSKASGWVSEVIACGVVIAVHLLKKNMYISIVTGTICYMILIRMIPLISVSAV